MPNNKSDLGLGLSLSGKFISTIAVTAFISVYFQTDMLATLMIVAVFVFVPGLANFSIKTVFSTATKLLETVFRLLGSIVEGVGKGIDRGIKSQKKRRRYGK